MKVALVGKTNVGKSTLFNLLVRKKTSIVSYDRSTTVDFQESEVDILGNKILFIDTGGYDISDTKIFDNSAKVFNKVDLIIFVTSLEGITHEDTDCLNVIRKLSKPILLNINKCEENSIVEGDFFTFGIKDITYTSCKSNYGIRDLKEKIIEKLNLTVKEISEKKDKEEIISLSIVGRPNAGKSTFLNAMLKEERVVVSDKAGTTRDSVSSFYEYNDMKFKITDTAGLKRKKTDDFIENISSKESFRAIDESDVCIIMLDSRNYMEYQDLKILSYVIKNGKVPLILFNKWDLIQDKKTQMDNIKNILFKHLTDMNEIKYFCISAINLRKNIIPQIKKLYDLSRTQVQTSLLNKWLKYAIENRRPPLLNKKKINFKYVVQTGTGPLKFTIFVSQVKIRRNYINYLKNSLIEEFGLNAVPVIIELKKSENPYIQKEESKKFKNNRINK